MSELRSRACLKRALKFNENLHTQQASDHGNFGAKGLALPVWFVFPPPLREGRGILQSDWSVRCTSRKHLCAQKKMPRRLGVLHG